MLLRKKVFILVVVTIFLLTSVTGSIFAQGSGGNEGNGGNNNEVIKPTIKITKFRPKEATKYTWKLSGEFSDWKQIESTDPYTSIMTLNAERTITEDILQLHIEADTTMDKTEHDLVIELGYMVEKKVVTVVETEVTPPVEAVSEETEDNSGSGDGSGDGSGNGSGDGSGKVDDDETDVEESFYSLRRFEISSDEYSLKNGKIDMDWETEDLDRKYFDEVTAFRLIVVFDRSRGSDGEVSANKTFELEEHEANGYTFIKSDDLQNLLNVKALTLDTSENTWLVNDLALPLVGNNDKFKTQVLATSTYDITIPESEPGGNIVTFTGYGYSESDDAYNVTDDILAELELEVPYIGKIPVYSDDKSISSIAYGYEGEVQEEIFEADKFAYTVSIATDNVRYDAEDPTKLILPTITALAVGLESELTSPFVSIEQASYENRTAEITVTAEDSSVDIYTVTFVYEGSSLATLSDISINIPQVAEANPFVFSPSQLSYEYCLPTTTAIEGSFIASYVPSDLNASAVKVDATTFPGVTSIIVTAEDQTTELEYKVFFTYVGYDPEDLEEDNGSDNANQGDKDGNGQNKDNEEEETPAVLDSVNTLETLKIADYSLESFSPDLMEYDVELDEGTTELPLVTAFATSDLAVVEVIDTEILPGTSFVKVTAEDGTHKMYRVNFTVKGMEEGTVIQLIEEEVPVAIVDEVMGIWMPPTADGFKLDKSCSKISFWVSHQIITPQLWIMESKDIHTDIEDGTISIDDRDAVVIVTTSELKSSAGKGKHSRSTVENTDGGYYKFNLKGRNCPELETNEDYVLVVMNGDKVVYFGTGTPALLNFTVSEDTKTSVSHRNQDNNVLTRSSNSSMNK